MGSHTGGHGPRHRRSRPDRGWRARRAAVVAIGALVALAGPAVPALAAPPAVVAPLAAPSAPCTATGPDFRYVVVHRERTAPAAADAEIRGACGTSVVYYPEIAVSVVRSRAVDFQQRIGVNRSYSAQKDRAVPGDGGQQADGPRAPRGAVDVLRGERERERAVGPTAVSARFAAPAAPTPSAPTPSAQWDMDAIRAPQARAIDPGRRSVVVGVVDSGIEARHPAFRASLARDRSVGCVTGAPRTGEANWTSTDSDHGTHVAGTIAGRDPASGFTGVAPGVSVASVKVVDGDGMIYPEATVCGLVWSARQGFAVTNHSYYIDPGYFYCTDRPGQAAVVEAVGRAVRFAMSRGSTTVAAAGNNGFDATAQTTDPTRGTRVDRGCGVMPSSIPGVVSVSSVGFAGRRAGYSNWGAGYVDVTAPGGATEQPVPGRRSGCVLSAITGGRYGEKCGTSMAAPHAAGVLALLAGRSPSSTGASLLARQADPVACSDTACSGPAADNSYYGRGLVDALDAVRTPAGSR